MSKLTPERIRDLRQMPYDEYLQTPEWKRRRKAAVAYADSRCQLCNKEGEPLNVHHRTYDNRGAEMPQDLTVLCKDCHARHHGKDKALILPGDPVADIVGYGEPVFVSEVEEMACAWWVFGRNDLMMEFQRMFGLTSGGIPAFETLCRRGRMQFLEDYHFMFTDGEAEDGQE